MTTDEAILDYADAARDLRSMATSQALYVEGACPYTPIELLAFASIAERAAEAEANDPLPAPHVICTLCAGVRVCDIAAHRARARL